MRHILGVTALFICTCSILHANTYTLATEGEQVVFEAAPELGYVTKLSDKKSSFMSVAGSPLKDVAYAHRLPGRERSNVWLVKNGASASVNREMITRLKLNSRISYAAPMFSVNGEAVGVIPEVVVKVGDGIEQDDIKALCESLGLTIIKPMEFTTQEYLLEVLGPGAEAVFTAVEQLNEVDSIEWAAPNTAFQPKLAGQALPSDYTAAETLYSDAFEQDPNTPGVFPDDEYFPMQWHLYNTGQSGGTPGADIRAPEAWEITTGDPNVAVALVDTGVDGKHPDLIGNVVAGYDFLEDDNDPSPAFAALMDHHGTWSAGLVAAQGNNSIGVAGVSWNCSIMPIRISNYHADGSSSWISWADIAKAYRWAASHGADILSNGWISENHSPVFYSALADVTEPGGIGRDGKGCVVFFAAGPFGAYPDFGAIDYQSARPEVVAVGATDDNDVRLEYSAYGSELDILAPGAPYPSLLPSWYIPGRSGAGIWTTGISGSMDYFEFGGTSAATPIAAGVAALILSIEPNLTNEEVRHFLTRSAKDLGDPGRDDYYGWGRVDARAALDMVLAKRADLDNDWRVDLDDLVILIESWGMDDPLADIAPAMKRDGVVDDQDLELMMQYWDIEIPEMDAG